MRALLTFVICLICTLGVSQEDTDQNIPDLQSIGKNEININVLYTVFKAIELNYERFLDEDISIGLAGNYWFGESSQWDYSAIAYGRIYPFSDKPNNALFVELNAAVFNSYEEGYYQPVGLHGAYTYVPEEKTTAFGMGFAIGAKFYSKKGYTFNFYGGLIRNFVEDQYPESIPRVGINVGKRF